MLAVYAVCSVAHRRMSIFDRRNTYRLRWVYRSTEQALGPFEQTKIGIGVLSEAERPKLNKEIQIALYWSA